MDPDRKSRSGVISVIVALVAVGVFWLIFLFGREAYKTYKSEGDLKKTLQTIQPPPGAKLVSIKSQHQGSVTGPVPTATATYSIDSQFDKVREHYLAEFARHGFVHTRDDKSAGGQINVQFCAPGYLATLDITPLQPSGLQLPASVKTQTYFIGLIKLEGLKC